ncbi:MAG: type II secretion system protein [Planctomycetota bacterium]|nr:type II secretion system protein [Planctomycetota bacterium]
MNARTLHHGGWTLVELMVAILIISILAGLSLSVGSAILASSDTRRTEDLLTLLNAATQEYAHVEGREPTYGINGYPVASVDVFRGSQYDIDLGITLLSQGGCDDCAGGLGQRLDYRLDPVSVGFPTETQLACSQWTQVEGCTGGGHAVYEGIGAWFMLMLNERTASRSILASIEPDLLLYVEVNVPVDGGDEEFHSFMPVDAWGNPVLVVLPGHGRDGADTFGYPRKDADGTVRTKEEHVLGPALRSRAYFVSAGPDGKYGNIEYDQSLGENFDPNASDEAFLQSKDNIYSYEVASW